MPPKRYMWQLWQQRTAPRDELAEKQNQIWSLLAYQWAPKS
jgi:hypothetical protein